MSKTTVGTVSVMVGANVRQLNRGLARASQRIGQFTRTIGRTARRLATFTAAATTAAAAIGTFLVRQQLQAIENTAQLSRRIGIATGDLVGLELAAARSGSSAETLQQSVQRLTRRLGQAAEGSGQAGRALEMLGLDAQQLIQMRPDEQMRTLADAFAQMENPARQAAAAQDLFGRQGLELVAMLRKGGDGLDEYRQRADQLGLTFDDVTGRQVSGFFDAMADLRALVSGFARQIAVQLAPLLHAGANRLADMGIEGANMGERVRGAIESVTMVGAKFLDAIQQIPLVFKSMQMVATQAIAWIIRHIEKADRAVRQWVENVTRGALKINSTLDVIADEMEHTANRLENELMDAVPTETWSDKVGKFFSELEGESAKMAERMDDNMSGLLLPEVDEIDPLGRELGEAMGEGFKRTGLDDGVDLIRAGTAAAQREAHSQMRRQSRVENIEKQQLQQQKRTTSVLERIDRNLTPGLSLPVADFGA